MRGFLANANLQRQQAKSQQQMGPLADPPYQQANRWQRLETRVPAMRLRPLQQPVRDNTRRAPLPLLAVQTSPARSTARTCPRDSASQREQVALPQREEARPEAARQEEDLRQVKPWLPACLAAWSRSRRLSWDWRSLQQQWPPWPRWCRAAAACVGALAWRSRSCQLEQIQSRCVLGQALDRRVCMPAGQPTCSSEHVLPVRLAKLLTRS